MRMVTKGAFVDQALRKLAVATGRSNHDIVCKYATGIHIRVTGKVLLPGLPLAPTDASTTIWSVLAFTHSRKAVAFRQT